ncbi:DUF481 domain-containing protein [Chromohalobacter sp. TMW 2.2308]|uniref:DUF481 domain-containing protein n=1 Tax=Chromohalobacter moromii TaxID=2860329 RepID=A0A9X2X545_9GAMM|nr:MULTISPECIES: DUF481 domain-containing protein [Chromohalobacter]CDQ33879.1 Putative salt-induced outer membrane protein [Virgibacillus halodenitrificans]MCK2041186.1 DUF481 domain-containing protein [Chromohalobacter moromii]MCK2046816.1 DUF481 domain-containing protein [Chromohalobacter moromii]MCT8506392.1 DUF481 domain-containing protein [Chromohalobacter moromii]MCT8513334.1 DUF481 domain-containing protein [Chromohalobacter sp. TMW 2.2271]
MLVSRDSRWLLLVILLGATLPVHADLFYAPPAPQDDAPKMSGEAELGYTHLSGNSNSRTLLAKGRLTWLTGRHTHTLRGETRSVQENDETSTEQYLLGGRERYELEGPHYLFGFGRWEKDRFSGYDYQFTTIGGYGRQWLDGPTHTLSTEFGPGYRHDAYQDGKEDDLGLAYAALDYRWNISEGAYFEQAVSVEAAAPNTTTRSISSLTSQLNSHLALKMSFEVKNNTSPPDGAEANTDRTTSMSLLYSW